MCSMARCRYPTSGIASCMISPSVLMMKRMTPWVEGCCGPMLRVISSPESWYAKTSSLIAAPLPSVRFRRRLDRRSVAHHREPLLVRRRPVVEHQQVERRRARGGHLAVLRRLLPVLAQRVADPVVGEHHAPQVGVAGEADAH